MNSENKVGVPLSVITTMAKREINAFTLNCMKANSIPTSLMVSVLKEVLFNVMQMESEQISNEYVNLQERYGLLQSDYEKLKEESKNLSKNQEE